MFSCPEIAPFWLTTEEPELFVNENAKINTATANPRPVNYMTKILTSLDIPSRLNIIVGEQDEEEYIFPVIGNFGIKPEVVNQRRKNYLSSFKNQCKEKFPGVEISIAGWSELSKSSPTIQEDLLSMQYVDEESERISSFFQPSGYYAGLKIPSLYQLKEISKLKMQTYAKQGWVLKNLFPTGIGIQNEVPAQLRTLMLNALLIGRGRERLPMLYPFNPRTSIY
jgi:hypothetical protein